MSVPWNVTGPPPGCSRCPSSISVASSLLLHHRLIPHNWLLNNKGLNCLGPFIHRFFFNKQTYTKFSPVQSPSRVRLFATPWVTAHQASLSITSSRSSLRLMSIESVMPSSHLILGRHLLLLTPRQVWQTPLSFPSAGRQFVSRPPFHWSSSPGFKQNTQTFISRSLKA